MNVLQFACIIDITDYHNSEELVSMVSHVLVMF